MEGIPASQLLSRVRFPLLLNTLSRHTEPSLQLHGVIVLYSTLTARQKSKCAMAMAEADKALVVGADEELWILEVTLIVSKAVAT